MKRSGYIVLLLIFFVSCQKFAVDYKGSIQLTPDKTSEQTTHVFSFSVDPEQNVPKGDKIYTRIDWEGDGQWDMPYTQDLELHHRYYIPGNYTLQAEFLTKSGLLLKDSLTIKVDQGFSPPRANFTPIPDEGHFKTTFIFDARLTADDEDSLDQLQFRWDVFDDGLWETDYLDTAIFRYQFERMGYFQVRLNVKDPSGRFHSINRNIRVHAHDTLIQIQLNQFPLEGSVVDTFHFDASGTLHEEDPNREFSYAWKFPNTPTTIPHPDSAKVSRIFEKPGFVSYTVFVTDQYGLQNSLSREMYVNMGNRPPHALFEVPQSSGNVSTLFYFNLWGSRDDHTAASNLKKRWDWDGDGKWDTPYNTDMEVYHQFSTPGTYPVTLQVMDEERLMHEYTLNIYVSPYSNPTSYIVDVRDEKLYGTVQIGNHWWMSENLDFRTDDKMDIPMLQRCYDDVEENCITYGSLYEWARVFDYQKGSRQLCPRGWHIPGKEELDDLQANLPSTNPGKALEKGGMLDFNGQYAGIGAYTYMVNTFGTITDTIYDYHGMDEKMYLPTTRVVGGEYIYHMTQSKHSPTPHFFNYLTQNVYFPIRCVKD